MFLKFLVFSTFLVSCVSIPPNKEYALAYTSLHVVKQKGGDKYAPKEYRKALFLYKKAISLYNKKMYEEARDSFEDSLNYFERAEMKALIKKRVEDE